ncbi:hypothetical protein AWZ03_013552 [Drosophila navojoa]|uniref:One cut domain family member n=1 Tax=Drosophila navojoa TaxID=7232 RepID=A0A484AUE5_DRONA|nr:homeobox protein onecut [Drosophila navojoa]TDG40028.1 hypothetical protein AWZ03_013552 [Drosophila navojoa]
MESMNDIIDSQAFSHQQLIVETTEFIGEVGQERTQKLNQTPTGESDALNGMKYVKSPTLQTLIASTDSVGRIHDGDEDNADELEDGEEGAEHSSSVVMVIDELGSGSTLQTTYQLVPEQLQLQDGPRALSLLPMHHADEPPVSPVEFDGSDDISLDGLSTQIIAVKQEHKLVIVQRDPDTNRIINRRTSPHLGLNMSHVNVIDELSSDGIEEVTLNQHHQQLLDEQQHHHQHHQHNLQQQQQHQHHQQNLLQYGQRLVTTSEIIHHHHQQQQHQQQRQLASGQGSHRESLSVIVQTHDDDDDDIDDDDEEVDEHVSASQSLSPPLTVEHSTYQTLTSVNNHRISEPSFSPTSYATLTPIQPLPPISTMSDKFAYAGGHINSGNGNSNNNNATIRSNNNNNSSNSNSDQTFTNSLPLPIEATHQGSLSNLNLSGLVSDVQSSYSNSYDKLPSLISPTPHTYASSPSQGLSGLVNTCDLQSHSSTVSSPVNGSPAGGHLQLHKASTASIGVTIQKQVICLSPTTATSIADYEASYRPSQQPDQEILMSRADTTDRNAQLRLQHSPTLSSPSVSAASVVSMSLHSPASVVTLPHINGSVNNLSADLPVVVNMSPTPTTVGGNDSSIDELVQQQLKSQHNSSNADCHVKNDVLNSLDICNINQQQHQQNGFNSDQAQPLQHQQQQKLSPKLGGVAANPVSRSTAAAPNDMEEINTKELAQRISAELKRYSIPQAIFAQRVLCRSQGTLSDLLRNPKPWSKLKSGRETFRRMFKWLQEPEFQRMSALRMAAAQIPQRPSAGAGTGSGNANIIFASTTPPGSGSTIVSGTSSVAVTPSTTLHTNESSGTTHGSSTATNAMLSSSGLVSSCRRKEEPHIEQMPQPKKPRLVFTDLQRRTLQAIFKETKRPSKEMQVTIARQLGLEPTTVGNFFMNARRRSMDKWRDDDNKNSQHSHSRQHQHQQQHEHQYQNQQDQQPQHQQQEEEEERISGHYGNLHTTAMSPLGNFEDNGEMDLELEHHDFLVDDHDDDEHEQHDDIL